MSLPFSESVNLHMNFFLTDTDLKQTKESTVFFSLQHMLVDGVAKKCWCLRCKAFSSERVCVRVAALNQNSKHAQLTFVTQPIGGCC